MNFLTAIYPTLHYSQKKKGELPIADPFSGTLVLCCCLIMLTLSITGTLMLLSDTVYDFIDDTILDFVGGLRSKAVVYLIIFGLMLIYYPLIRYTVGRNSAYGQHISRFYALSEEEQAALSLNTWMWMIASLFSFVLPFLVWFLLWLIGA